MRRQSIALAALCALAACGNPGAPRPSVVSTPVEPGWGNVIDVADTLRIEQLDTMWREALAKARVRNAAALEEEGPLLVADAALEYPELPPGSYHCRVIRLGDVAGRRKLRRFRPFFCYIRGEADDQRSFTKQTGTDLPSGWLYPDGDRRYVFLGARQREPGDNSLRYGTDPDRNLAGVVERVDAFRWRLVVPGSDAKGLEIYELTPVATAQQAP